MGSRFGRPRSLAALGTSRHVTGVAALLVMPIRAGEKQAGQFGRPRTSADTGASIT